jgi:hypothetical protein
LTGEAANWESAERRGVNAANTLTAFFFLPNIRLAQSAHGCFPFLFSGNKEQGKKGAMASKEERRKHTNTPSRINLGINVDVQVVHW